LTLASAASRVLSISARGRQFGGGRVGLRLQQLTAVRAKSALAGLADDSSIGHSLGFPCLSQARRAVDGSQRRLCEFDTLNCFCPRLCGRSQWCLLLLSMRNRSLCR
jgi:hypothetical protein